MEFVWNDGGRAACGYVGFTSDCATRAIAIATGAVYRDVYEQLGNLADHSPRLGLSANLARDFLAKHNWQLHPAKMPTFDGNVIPKGVVIVHAAKDSGKSHHLCSVIDHVVHDTWNPSDDVQYQVLSFWTRPAFANVDNLPTIAPRRPTSNEQELTQAEFDKILHRLKALDRTATNSGSTEAEKHNALRMMQNLMLRHNLSREDIVDGDNVESVRFTRIACPVNGRRTCQWEHSLAWYISQHIFTTTQYYYSTEGHRAMFWFYGPVDDVNNAIALFRELLLTIATAAHLQFGGYARGSGASYAEGYVRGLPRWNQPDETQQPKSANRQLIQIRELAVRSAAKHWLQIECDIRLVKGSSSGRYQHDDAAERQGRLDGAQHNLNVPNAPKRITQR